MKTEKNFKKYCILVIMAGIFIFFWIITTGAMLPLRTSAASKTYNKNITVGSIEIGGLSKEEASFRLREKIVNNLKNKSLKITCGKDVYSFYYPEINYESNIDALLTSLLKVKPKTKTDYTFSIYYYLNNIDGVIENINSNYYTKADNAEIIFLHESNYPFKFLKEKQGREIDKKHLKAEIEKSINSNFYLINARNITILPEITQNDLNKLTFLRSSFSTYYGHSSEERKHNICLASRFISGTVLESGEEFSFNKTVGDRSVKRGFKQAKIIFDGKFVDGVGGGVCQISTTLYNAALVAGLEITEQHPHTLSVSYIEPSFDAMVNSYTSDLKFVNNTKGKIFIKITTDSNRLSVYIYGTKNEYVIKRISLTKSIIPPPAPEIIPSDTEEIVQKAKNGLESEGYIRIYKDGEIVETRRIRTDKYKPVQEIRKILQN